MAEDYGDGFAMDMADTRFGSLYTSSDYAIDPTHPKYRRTEVGEQLLGEIQKRHGSVPAHEADVRPTSTKLRKFARAVKPVAPPVEAAPTEERSPINCGFELSRLVASFKSKTTSAAGKKAPHAHNAKRT